METRKKEGSYKANSGSFKKGIGGTGFPKGQKNPKLSQTRKEMFKQGLLDTSKEKNGCWKGGITPLRELIRKTEKYKSWRTVIFIRDNRKCVKCGSKQQIEAHHKKSMSLILEEHNIRSTKDALNCEELWDLNNGETLCNDCHRNTDSYGNGKQVIMAQA